MIILYATFLLWAAAYVIRSERMRYALAPARRARGPLFTFVVDPVTFLAVGFFSVLFSLVHLKGRALTQQEFRTRRKWLDRAFTAFVVGFWAMEVLTYFDLLNIHRGMYPNMTGNEFMWNGYLDKFGFAPFGIQTPTYLHPGMNLLALLLLAVQLPCLIFARRMGYNMGFLLDRNNWSRPKRKPAPAATSVVAEQPPEALAPVAQASEDEKLAEAKKATS